MGHQQRSLPLEGRQGRMPDVGLLHQAVRTPKGLEARFGRVGPPATLRVVTLGVTRNQGVIALCRCLRSTRMHLFTCLQRAPPHARPFHNVEGFRWFPAMFFTDSGALSRKTVREDRKLTFHIFSSCPGFLSFGFPGVLRRSLTKNRFFIFLPNGTDPRFAS